MPYDQVILASASPRRRELLRQVGVAHEARPADLDESRRPGERPEAYVLRLAREKAETVARGSGATLPVLAADTAVVLGDEILGKPRDRQDALRMLAALSGREHRVMTGVALAWEGRLQTAFSETRVGFRPLEPQECIAYWQTGEPADKAGAYAIQGLGAVFVERIDGSHSGVMGLPLFETVALLDAAGVRRWRTPA